MSDRTEMRIERMPLAALMSVRHGGNPKAHNIEALIESLLRFGFVAPPTIDDATGMLVAGHGRITALAKLQAEREAPPDGIGVGADGDWTVPVIRGIEFDDDAERDAYLVADNQLTIAGGWNMEALATMLDDIGRGNHDGLGFNQADLDNIFAAARVSVEDVLDNATGTSNEPLAAGAPTGPAGMVVEVDIPDELPRVTISKVGDVWMLGEHRLVVGDMTLAEVLGAALDGKRPDLIWTDPPWNVAYAGASKTREKSTIENDDLGEDFINFAAKFAGSFAAAADPGTPIYIAMSSQEWGVLHTVLKQVGFHWSSTIIWAKQSLVLSRKDFHPQYEPIWYGWRDGAARKCAPTDRAMSDVWTIDRPRKSDLHPTMKPIALVARSIGASSHPGDLVFDPFGGSGTTILAAEQMGRKVVSIELDPHYADVILQRYEKLTGRSPRKL